MNFSQILTLPRTALLGCALLSLVPAGCVQAVVGGQTLPSAYYLMDDVQYFPAGPEMKLSREVEAHERYQLRQQGLAEDLPPVP